MTASVTAPAADTTPPPPRTHAERIRTDLTDIRKELIEVAGALMPDVLSAPPAPGVRTPRELLQEIGTMEVMSLSWSARQEMPDWGEVWNRLDAPTSEQIMANLAAVRADTLAYLATCTEEQLETPIPLADDWRQFFNNDTHIEPEELLRWVAKHEYYHLGQLYTYQFLRAAGK